MSETFVLPSLSEPDKSGYQPADAACGCSRSIMTISPSCQTKSLTISRRSFYGQAARLLSSGGSSPPCTTHNTMNQNALGMGEDCQWHHPQGGSQTLALGTAAEKTVRKPLPAVQGSCMLMTIAVSLKQSAVTAAVHKAFHHHPEKERTQCRQTSNMLGLLHWR